MEGCLTLTISEKLLYVLGNNLTYCELHAAFLQTGHTTTLAMSETHSCGERVEIHPLILFSIVCSLNIQFG